MSHDVCPGVTGSRRLSIPAMRVRRGRRWRAPRHRTGRFRRKPAPDVQRGKRSRSQCPAPDRRAAESHRAAGLPGRAPGYPQAAARHRGHGNAFLRICPQRRPHCRPRSRRCPASRARTGDPDDRRGLPAKMRHVASQHLETAGPVVFDAFEFRVPLVGVRNDAVHYAHHARFRRARPDRPLAGHGRRSGPPVFFQVDEPVRRVPDGHGGDDIRFQSRSRVPRDPAADPLFGRVRKEPRRNPRPGGDRLPDFFCASRRLHLDPDPSTTGLVVLDAHGAFRIRIPDVAGSECVCMGSGSIFMTRSRRFHTPYDVIILYTVLRDARRTCFVMFACAGYAGALRWPGGMAARSFRRGTVSLRACGFTQNGSESRIDDVGEVGSERIRKGNGSGEFEVRRQFALLQENFFQGGIPGRERQLILDHFKISLYAER